MRAASISGPKVYSMIPIIVPLVVLAMGNMLSNLLRTLPAIATDVMQASLAVDARELAQLVSIFHLTFAMAQIPVGVALDRYGPRKVAMILLATVAVGSVMAAALPGALGHGMAQAVLGIGCSGLLLCPMMFAARHVQPAQFGLWSGVIMGLGGCGMLLSASPLAWLVEAAGWQAAFWICGALAIALAVLTLALLPIDDGSGHLPHRTLKADFMEVLRLGGSRVLRPVVLTAFFSFAAVILIRGLWGGPWLMDTKGMSRVEAGQVLTWFTIALIVGSFMAGMLDKWLGRRRMLIAGAHALAGVALLALVAGAPNGLQLGWATLGNLRHYDAYVLGIYGLSLGMYPLLFAVARDAVAGAQVGKALAAVNLAFFVGTALLQSASGFTVVAWGLSTTLALVGICLLGTAAVFLRMQR